MNYLLMVARDNLIQSRHCIERGDLENATRYLNKGWAARRAIEVLTEASGQWAR